MTRGKSSSPVFAASLAEVDSANAAACDANPDALLHRLDRLNDKVGGQVAPARGVPFIVSHDSYRYFQDRFSASPPLGPSW